MTEVNEPPLEDSSLDRWIAGFRSHSLREGIRPEIFESAFRGVRLDPEVVRKDRNQSEFTTPIWDYIATAVSAERVENGRIALRRHADLLERIESEFGVEKEVIVAIWGVESAYGEFRGEFPTIKALATLVHDGRRRDFFRRQLLAALHILQAGDTSPGRMNGSWAGAMGHTQFMPETFMNYARDFDGDGRRDIWGEDPTDALASTASYLAVHGWVTGQPWGMEVLLPKGFDYSLTNRQMGTSTFDWQRLGVMTTGGLSLPDHDEAAILLPAGHRGAAFIIFNNFKVLRKYNAADSYAIGVGHLASRLSGGAPIQAHWPRGNRVLTAAEVRDLQRLLLDRGLDPIGVDGIVGPGTIAAVQAYQSLAGLVADGFPSLEVLESLR